MNSSNPVISIIYLAVVVFEIYCFWKLFVKAGKPGWAGIIPIYNLYVMLGLIGKPTWWLILFFIPIVNLVFSIITYIAFAERFGKGAGFGVGLTFLSFIFMPILAFGDATFTPLDAATPPEVPQ